MIEHAGRGTIFSVLIVVAFTVIFHDAEVHRTAPTRPAAPAVPEAGAHRPGTPAAPRVTPAVTPGPSTPPPAITRVDRPTSMPIAPPAVARTSPPNNPTIVRPVGFSAVAERSAPRPGSLTVTSSIAEPARPREGFSLPIGSPPTRAESPVRSPRSQRGAFTIIGPGETLRDVAVRVYGTAEARMALWRANRDRLAGLDTPVAEGWLIRTP